MTSPPSRYAETRAALALAFCLAASPAFPAAPAAETVTEELIRLLAERMALPREDADRLIRRLREEQAARAGTLQSTPVAASFETPPDAAPPPADPRGRVRVVYLPETEKQRLRTAVREDVLDTARKENWALPGAVPQWVKGIRLDGDLRLRQEFDLLDPSNGAQFINFQSVNSGAPLNTNPLPGQPLTVPVLNSTEDRQQFRVRARIGISAEVNEWLSASLRLATGNLVNPVSTNQVLGNDFNKVALVLDRAWLDFHPDARWAVRGGRMPAPWQSTELVWDEDLGFDGLSGTYRHEWSPRLQQFGTLGAFAISNTDFNYPASSLSKENSRDKWLLGAQTGLQWRFDDRLAVHAAIAYYDFVDYEGELSAPCYAPTTAVACETDISRPGFLQKGNTLFGLRDLVVLAPTDPTYQYFGLASEFRVLDLNLRVDRRLEGDAHLILEADFAYNLGYDEDRIEALVPVNNFGSCPAGDPACTPGFEGGGYAYLLNLIWGVPKIVSAGQWNVFAGYRRLESDAVPDAFTDSDFHLGGTNAKGYHLGMAYGLATNTWLSARWLSATEVTGAPLSIDVLQLDLNTRF
jgi:Putative porin